MGENFAMEKATFAAKKTEMDITTVDMSCRETYRLNAHRTMPPEKEEEVPMAVKDDGFIVKEAASMVKTEVGEQEPPEKMRKVEKEEVAPEENDLEEFDLEKMAGGWVPVGSQLLQSFSTSSGGKRVEEGAVAVIYVDKGGRIRYSIDGRDIGRLQLEDSKILEDLLSSEYLKTEAAVVDVPPESLRINMLILLHVKFFVNVDLFKSDANLHQNRFVHLLRQYGWMKTPTVRMQNYISSNASTKCEVDETHMSVAESIPGLTCSLRPYQKLCVAWMVARERQTLKAVAQKNPFWTEVKLDRYKLYCNQATGSLSLKMTSLSKTCRGGIVADEMGLGKTIEAIGTILANPPSSEEANTFGGTLVVCPMSILSQWVDEIGVHAPGLQVVRYYGCNRFTHGVDSLNHKAADVVVTTYGILGSESRDIGSKLGRRPPLFQIEWHRIILDEAHNIKGRTTICANATFQLHGRSKWALTGTPIHNNPNDLFSLLKFLSLDPWHEFKYWTRHIVNNYNSGNAELVSKAEELIRLILTPIVLRRTKDSCDEEGKPILQLPKLTTEIVRLTPSVEEKDFYNMLFTRSRTSFDLYVAQDKVLSNLVGVLQLLLRLRQCCDHPFLVLSAPSKDINDMEDFDSLAKRFLKGDESAATKGGADDVPSEYVRKVVSDLKSGTLLADAECPICLQVMDDGVFSSCAHAACRDCFYSCFRNQSSAPCPVCRKTINKADLVTIPRASRFSVDVRKKWRPSKKVEHLMSDLKAMIAEGQGEKAIVFSQWTSFLDILQVPLEQDSIEFLRLDGSLSQTQRTEVLHSFEKDEKYPVLLMSLKAGGVGLNLVRANHVFLMDPWWNPAVEDQAIGRVHRMGQTREVFVKRYIVQDTVEERLLVVQEKKRLIAEGALEESTDDSRKARLDEVMFLFS